MMNTPTPMMNTHHVCYEGTLACSGCNPCPHCLNVVNREVLALAMRRTTEVITQSRGPHGVVAVSELDTQNFWAIFYGYYGEAWRNLHTAMMNDPKVAERAYDLRNIPGFEQTGGYVPPPPVIAPPMPPAPPAVMPLSMLATQAVPPYAPGAPGVAPAWSAPFPLRDAPGDAPAPSTMVDVTPRVVDATPAVIDSPAVATPADIRRAITSDDIAASATVLDGSVSVPVPAPSSNGATSGAVHNPSV